MKWASYSCALPCLYCDVSDVWRIPSKWKRMAVSAAGMIVELVIAAVALILWWHTEPGLLHTWLLGLVIICSISTLAVNANPLLRYDGYYLLSDLLEIPNLSGRASGLWGERLARLAARPITRRRSIDQLEPTAAVGNLCSGFSNLQCGHSTGDLCNAVCVCATIPS